MERQSYQERVVTECYVMIVCSYSEHNLRSYVHEPVQTPLSGGLTLSNFPCRKSARPQPAVSSHAHAIAYAQSAIHACS